MHAGLSRLDVAGKGGIPELLAEARALKAQREWDEAAALWLIAQAREWHASGHFNEQQEAAALVLEALPDHFEALHLLGYGAQINGDYAQAEDYFTRALAAKPDYAFSTLALAQIRMMRTRFKQGRDGYEARFDAVTEASGPDWRGLPVARWRGESVADKKMYLWAEQGLGDIVMFAGLLPHLLAQSPRRLALGMYPKLISLFARSFPAVSVEPLDNAILHALGPSVLTALPKIEQLAQFATVPIPLGPLKEAHAYATQHGFFDLAAPMGDLLVQLLPEITPAQHPSYLKADPALVSATRARLSAIRPGRRIGISWHTANRREFTRTLPLEQWLPLLAMPGCHFVSLQHQADAKEIRAFCAKAGCTITIDETVDPLADAEGLAALIAAMDAVVTIDNSNAHLAGALGVPTLLLLPKGCNYRWPELDGGGTLWYASVTTLRQEKPGKWDPVVAQAAAHLQTL